MGGCVSLCVSPPILTPPPSILHSPPLILSPPSINSLGLELDEVGVDGGVRLREG